MRVMEGELRKGIGRKGDVRGRTDEMEERKEGEVHEWGASSSYYCSLAVHYCWWKFCSCGFDLFCTMTHFFVYLLFDCFIQLQILMYGLK